ncbi:MAG: hypothetical protein K6A36_04720 [Paludibacteraceae bacterium]|nr:hypothetical protein [Paludibacteraceae bacterium]
MRKLITLTLAACILAACGTSEKQLRERAAELCQYIPDHVLLEQSKDYMTSDFYAVLDTMFNLPQHEALDHEWLYYFVTGNGGTIADYTVADIEIVDSNHAVATIQVRQKWEDGSFDPNGDVEDHMLYMERVDGVWLMSDFDGHKADCIRHIVINRKEQAVRQAISDYLAGKIGPNYMQGELCIPVLMIVQETDSCVWGDFWVYWYNISGDTLKTVSGGNHAGMMQIRYDENNPSVISFEQTEDGAGNEADAQRIFGDYYDIYQGMHSRAEIREAVRKEQLEELVKRNNLHIRYYQDYGWPAVELH